VDTEETKMNEIDNNIVLEWCKKNGCKILNKENDMEAFCTFCSSKTLIVNCYNVILKNSKNVFVGQCSKCYNVCIRGK